ncbi:MAG: glycerol kinase GlpK [bacterium]
MTDYICAIDQGTTGSKALILDDELTVHSRVVREFEQIYPEPSWVEHDPESIWYSTLEAIAEARQLAGIDPGEIEAVGITNQRETTLLWDRATGDPVYNAIVWQDRRTADRLETLKDAGHEDAVREKTGLLLDPYFSAPKLEWIFNNVENSYDRAINGELAFGTVDSFLLWRLTGGEVHGTDPSNASRTLLLNLETGDWDPALLDLFDIPEAVLPRVLDSSGTLGTVQDVEPLQDGTPICGLAGDQQAALFGQACFESGQAKCTYGTGAFLLSNIGNEIVLSENRLLTSAGWRINGEITYILEGSAFMAGAMVQWLRDGLGIIDSADEVEALARRVDDSGDVVVVPSFTGLGAPYWKADARGLITGLTRNSSDAHIARATLEGIALQNRDIFEAMENDLGGQIHDVRVDGGASQNNLLMQLQADFLNQSVTRPAMTETTLLGAGMLAGLGCGIYSSLSDLKQEYPRDETFEATMSEEDRSEAIDRWKNALSKI